MFFYLANQAEITSSLKAQRSTASAGAINGDAVDLAKYNGPVLLKVSAPAASSGDTIDFTVQHSEDGSTSWASVPAASLVNPDTGAAATFSQVTDAAAREETLALKRDNLRRYIRLVATTAGASIDVVFAGIVVGEKASY
jgi:hypothetical protein